MSEYIDKMFKDEQIERIQFKLNIPKTTIHLVLSEYIKYLRNKLANGETAKFLNICYLRVRSDTEEVHETLAYIATELARSIKVSPVTVNAVLSAYEEVIVNNLSAETGITVRGLVRIKLEGGKVRTKKSTSYNGYDIYVTTLPSFKRKVEVAV